MDMVDEDRTEKAILHWMNYGIEKGKTVPNFEELLDQYREEIAEEARREERERIVEWAKTHDMPYNMPDDALAGYNEALVRLIALLSDK